MRIEPFSIEDPVHVIKRGARGMDIFQDESDRWLFLKSLFILNDTHKSFDWRKETAKLKIFERPKHWPDRKPLVQIIAWTLLPNHVHLLLKEKEKGGISKFMQRVGGSMTLAFNQKYRNQGSIFQGAYKAKRVGDDDYFKYLVFYVLVKNTFEMFPGGIKAALSDFERAWNWAMNYPFSSFRYCLLNIQSPILDDPGGLMRNFIDSSNFKKQEIYMLLDSYVKSSE